MYKKQEMTPTNRIGESSKYRDILSPDKAHETNTETAPNTINRSKFMIAERNSRLPRIEIVLRSRGFEIIIDEVGETKMN